MTTEAGLGEDSLRKLSVKNESSFEIELIGT
jgi:hypothetical protein